MYLGKKFKAFSMVELMMVLLISALIIAAIVPIVTRKHMQLPTIASHGAYFCYYGPRTFDPTTGTITDNTVVQREARWSGSDFGKLVYDKEVSNCVFEPPKKAAFFQVSAVGGGGGGSDSGYRAKPPAQGFTDENSVSPFNQTEETLKNYDLDKDMFKKYGGAVVAFAQARKSGDGGDMGWYNYKDETKVGACIKEYDKVPVSVDVEVEDPCAVKHEGTPAEPGYYIDGEKKFIVEAGAATYDEDSYCCNPPVACPEGDFDCMDKSACYSCTRESSGCKEGTGGSDHCQPDRQYVHNSASSPYAINLNGEKCLRCTEAQYWWVTPNDGSPAKKFYHFNPCQAGLEQYVTSTCSEDSYLDEDYECQKRSESELISYVYNMHACSYDGSSGVRCSDGGENSPTSYITVDEATCKYTVHTKTENLCFTPCEPKEETIVSCTQTVDPIDKKCPVHTGYETDCYELITETDEEGNITGYSKGSKIPCPSCVIDYNNVETGVTGCGYHAGASGTSPWCESGTKTVQDTKLYCKTADGGTKEPNADGSCDCELKADNYKVHRYELEVQDGANGANGARCNTDFVPVDLNLKYYDASNPTGGDYANPVNSKLNTRESYNFYNARINGRDGNDNGMGSNVVNELADGVDALWYNPPGANGTISAEQGEVSCWDPTSVAIKEPESKKAANCTSPNVITFTEVRIDSPSKHYWVKANSSARGGAPGVRYQYVSKYDEYNGETITKADGSEIDDPIRLHKPYGNGASGLSGVCTNSGNYKPVTVMNNNAAVNPKHKTYYDIWNTVGNYDDTYETIPYGYILMHHDGTLEIAGKYKTYKSFDTNELATGIQGKPGSAATVVVKSIAPEDRSIVVGVGGSPAALGSGSEGTNGSPTYMGSLIRVEGGLGGFGNAPVSFEYPTLPVYDGVAYSHEDWCYFRMKLNSLPDSQTEYFGRKKADIPAGLNCSDLTSSSDYKYHIQVGGAFGGQATFAGGKPIFTTNAGPALTAFEKAGYGGQGGGVEHFCMASQKIIVFEGKIDYKNSVFREDVFDETSSEYDALFISGSFDKPTTSDETLAYSDSKRRIIPRSCYSETSVKSYNHISAGPGGDGYLLIRW